MQSIFALAVSAFLPLSLFCRSRRPFSPSGSGSTDQKFPHGLNLFWPLVLQASSPVGVFLFIRAIATSAVRDHVRLRRRRQYPAAQRGGEQTEQPKSRTEHVKLHKVPWSASWSALREGLVHKSHQNRHPPKPGLGVIYCVILSFPSLAKGRWERQTEVAHDAGRGAFVSPLLSLSVERIATGRDLRKSAHPVVADLPCLEH